MSSSSPTSSDQGLGPVYRVSELVYETIISFLMFESSGDEEFTGIRFMGTEWTVRFTYKQKGNFLTFASQVQLTDAADSSVKSCIEIRLRYQAAPNSLPTENDDWPGSDTEPLAGKWMSVDFEPGKWYKGTLSSVATGSLIGTTVSLLVKFRFYGLILRPIICMNKSCGSDALQTDYRKAVSALYPEMRGADITLVAEGQKFPVHRLVLICRSQYFAGHLEHDPKTEIELTGGVTAAVASEMIRFMYTGSVGQLSDLTFPLLEAADYYGITDLIELCTDHLIVNINAQNVTRIIDFANRSGLKGLEEAAVRTFIDHANDDDWSEAYAELSIPSRLIIRSLTSRFLSRCWAPVPSDPSNIRQPKKLPFKALEPYVR